MAGASNAERDNSIEEYDQFIRDVLTKTKRGSEREAAIKPHKYSDPDYNRFLGVRNLYIAFFLNFRFLVESEVFGQNKEISEQNCPYPVPHNDTDVAAP